MAMVIQRLELGLVKGGEGSTSRKNQCQETVTSGSLATDKT
jgi:hypothetical protein